MKEDIILVSIRLKSSIKTPKGHHIIRKAERALSNDRIRSGEERIKAFQDPRVTEVKI